MVFKKKDSEKKESKADASISTESSSPITEALSVYRDGQGSWILAKYKIQDDKIIAKTESVPNMKAVILNEFKMQAADTFFLDK